MIFSKANLVAVALSAKESLRKSLSGLFLSRDGSTVATNGVSLMAVGPVPEEDSVRFPDRACEQIDPGRGGLLIEADLIQKVLKQIPAKGLPYVALSRAADDTRVGLTSVEANGDALTFTGKPRPEAFPKWENAVRGVKDDANVQLCISGKELIETLTAVKTAMEDKGGISPLYLEINPEVGIIIRAQCWRTKQPIVAVVAVARSQEWLQHTDWERKVFRKPVKLRKRRRLG